MKQFIALFVLYVVPLDIYTVLLGVPFGHHAAMGMPVWLLAAGAAWLMSVLHIGFLKLAIRGAADRIQQAKRGQRSGY